jgi:hypothetical protein
MRRAAQTADVSTARAARSVQFALPMIQDGNLDSIDPTLLTAVTGGGLSLGDRSAPENPNAWAGPLERSAPQTTVPNSSYWGGIDAGMERMPANPGMDMGMSRQPFSSSADGSASAGLDI